MSTVANLTPSQPVCTPYHFCFCARDGGLPCSERGAITYINGAESHLPPADLTVYNPRGLSVEFRRCWSQTLVYGIYGTIRFARLPRGWTHNWDIAVEQSWSGVLYEPWQPIYLRYPTGQLQPLIPLLDGQGQPTGELVSGLGGLPPFWAEGEPDLSGGFWRRVIVHWDCETDWVFESAGQPGIGTLGIKAVITDQTHVIRFEGHATSGDTWRIVDGLTGQVLLTYDYQGAFAGLSRVTDCFGRKVEFIHDWWVQDPYHLPGHEVMVAVSDVAESNDPTPPIKWRFEYTADMTTNEWPPIPLLATHQDLGAGEGMYHLEYNGLYGRLSAELDPHRTRTEYSREADSLVQHVAIRPAGADAPIADWDLTLSGEVVVASTNPRHAAAVSYLDVDHVASVTWHDGRAVHYDYDARGNLAAVTDEGGRVTSLTWDYTADPRWADWLRSKRRMANR